MGKGQGGIVLLIIVVLVALFIFFLPRFFQAGPTTEPIRYKNDIITLENFQVSNLRPIKSSIVTISFDVTNNGDKNVDDVTIDFGGTTIATGDSLDVRECGIEGKEKMEKAFKRLGIPFTGKMCVFEKLASLDSQKVTAFFKVSGEGTRNIVILVKYPYSGAREALIPIVDDKTVKTPTVQFRQSQPSFGPFTVDIIPPTKAWAISDQPLEIKFKLRYVGSAAAGTPTNPIGELKIEKNKFAVDLSKGLKVAKTDGNVISCPKFEAGTIGKSCPNLKPDYPMVANSDIKVNKEYGCNLQADVGPELFGYKVGTIEVNFCYTFEFQKSQAINVIKEAA